MGAGCGDEPSASARASAVLVLRAWLEAQTDRPLRVRVTRVDDLASGSSQSFVTANPTELHAAIDDWLDALRAADG